jgi:hypothetical protein
MRDGDIITTSGRAQYPLEPDYHSLQGQFFIPESTQRLQMMSVDEFNKIVPNPDKTAQLPSVAMITGSFPVKHQPHTLVRGISSSASDTQKATIFGISYGQDQSEAITLAGTTGVMTVKAYSRVYKIELASAAVGTVTFTGGTSSADITLPKVATAGDMTVGTVAAAATTSTNIVGPGSLVRISMDADNAADQSQSVRLEGYTVNTTLGIDKVLTRETITTGADATDSVVSGNRYTEILSIQKGWDSTGTMIVKADPNAATVALIGPNQRSVEYPQGRFYNVPDGKTIRYRYIPLGVKMNNDNDIPPMPELFHQMIAEWAEKIVRGWHGDYNRGVRTLNNSPEFDRAVREARLGSKLEDDSSIQVGSGWQRKMRDRIDLPITPAS